MSLLGHLLNPRRRFRGWLLAQSTPAAAFVREDACLPRRAKSPHQLMQHLGHEHSDEYRSWLGDALKADVKRFHEETSDAPEPR